MRVLHAAIGLLVVLLPSSALAQSVPISFQARVTFASGVDAAVFSAGDPITISYTVDTSAADGNGDPQAGVFSGASKDLSVSFLTRGVFARGTSGLVQTFNNFESGGSSSDQVFVFSGPLASGSDLAGNPIQDAEVDFLSEWVPAPAEPMMLASDALPVVVPSFGDAFVILRTVSGTTFVHFEVADMTVRITANGSDGPVTITRGDALTVDIEFDAPGTGVAAANVGIGVVTPSAVQWLGPSGFTTTPTSVYSGPLPDFGPTPLANFASTAAFPPGNYYFFIFVHDSNTGITAADTVHVIVL